jgi:hypothetical protein
MSSVGVAFTVLSKEHLTELWSSYPALFDWILDVSQDPQFDPLEYIDSWQLVVMPEDLEALQRLLPVERITNHEVLTVKIWFREVTFHRFWGALEGTFPERSY